MVEILYLAPQGPALASAGAGRLECRIVINTMLGNGLKMRVIWNDAIGWTIHENGYSEPETVAAISKLLKPGMVFFDVGANIGQYTLLASRLAGDDGQVHSFEPAPEIFSVLGANVALNRLRNVFLSQRALSCDDTTKKLYFTPIYNTGGNSLRRRPGDCSTRFAEIACTTLDGYILSRGVKRVDFIKMDIEGAEPEALKGAEKLLSGREKPAIVLELNELSLTAFGSSRETLVRHLEGYGYSLLRLEKSGAMPYSPRIQERSAFNVLAVPLEKKKEIYTALAVEVRAPDG